MSKIKTFLWHEPQYDYELQTVNNMNVSEISNSKFLKKSDVVPDLLLTIRSIEKVNVAKDNEKAEYKTGMYFKEVEKPMVLNQTNGNRVAQFLEEPETDNWIGKKVVVFYDPTVEFSGKISGGIRIRQPKLRSAAQASEPKAMPSSDFDDDIPF